MNHKLKQIEVTFYRNVMNYKADKLPFDMLLYCHTFRLIITHLTINLLATFGILLVHFNSL